MFVVDGYNFFVKKNRYEIYQYDRWYVNRKGLHFTYIKQYLESDKERKYLFAKNIIKEEKPQTIEQGTNAHKPTNICKYISKWFFQVKKYGQEE